MSSTGHCENCGSRSACSCNQKRFQKNGFDCVCSLYLSLLSAAEVELCFKQHFRVWPVPPVFTTGGTPVTSRRPSCFRGNREEHNTRFSGSFPLGAPAIKILDFEDMAPEGAHLRQLLKQCLLALELSGDAAIRASGGHSQIRKGERETRKLHCTSTWARIHANDIGNVAAQRILRTQTCTHTNLTLFMCWGWDVMVLGPFLSRHHGAGLGNFIIGIFTEGLSQGNRKESHTNRHESLSPACGSSKNQCRKPSSAEHCSPLIRKKITHSCVCVLLKCLSLPDRAGLRYLQGMRDPLPAIHRTRGGPGKKKYKHVQTSFRQNIIHTKILFFFHTLQVMPA